jgi:hypothetical protein
VCKGERTQTSTEKSRTKCQEVEDAETKYGHDFTDWKANPIDRCNFCGISIDDPKITQQCDISKEFEQAAKEDRLRRGNKFIAFKNKEQGK